MSSDPGHTGVLVSDRQDRPVDMDGLASLAMEVLSGEGVEGELSLSFVDETEMAELHERFMDEAGPTDVLSFRMDDAGAAAEGDSENGGEPRLLGDVVICPSYAAGNNPDLAAELRLLVVHGILHLLGHDHEEPQEKALMWERQALYSEVAVP